MRLRCRSLERRLLVRRQQAPHSANNLGDLANLCLRVGRLHLSALRVGEVDVGVRRALGRRRITDLLDLLALNLHTASLGQGQHLGLKRLHLVSQRRQLLGKSIEGNSRHLERCERGKASVNRGAVVMLWAVASINFFQIGCNVYIHICSSGCILSEKFETWSGFKPKCPAYNTMTDMLITPFPSFSFHQHQVEAIAWMMGREAAGAEHVRGGILADEMGLGKTWMTVGLLLNAPVAETLLLVPPVLQPQWAEVLTQSEIPHRILGPPVAKGGGGSWTEFPGKREVHVTLATYDRAHHNSVLLSGTEYQRIVCDEGHIFRNGSHTKRFSNLVKIGAERRWILSGTPIQNKAADFRNLLRFLHMDSDALIGMNAVDVAETVLLRRTVGMVRAAVPTMPTERPTHIVHPVVIPVDTEEAAVFNSLIGRFEHAVEKHANGMVILELYLRIQQFVAHPAIYVEAMKRKFKGEYKRDAWTGTASKMTVFREALGTMEKVPTIVFGTFRSELDLAELELVKAGYKVFGIRGGMGDSRRASVAHESKAAAERGEAVAIVIQITAGGAGLNLQHCSRVLFLSSHWNPAVMDQAVARAYRMGQKDDVEVHYFLLADNIDRNIDRRMNMMHGTKRTVAVGIHEMLYCDSAADAEEVAEELNAVLPSVVEGVVV